MSTNFREILNDTFDIRKSASDAQGRSTDATTDINDFRSLRKRPPLQSFINGKNSNFLLYGQELTVGQHLGGLHQPNTVHRNTETTTSVTLFRKLVPLPKGYIDVEDAMERCIGRFVRRSCLRIFEVFEDERGAFLAIADALGWG